MQRPRSWLEGESGKVLLYHECPPCPRKGNVNDVLLRKVAKWGCLGGSVVKCLTLDLRVMSSSPTLG